ncbi:MAG: hypothetical protein U0V72_10795 [Cytophagales bacterium]
MNYVHSRHTQAVLRHAAVLWYYLLSFPYKILLLSEERSVLNAALTQSCNAVTSKPNRRHYKHQ